MTRIRLTAVVVAIAAVCSLFAQYGPGYQDLPLPGAGTSGPTYRISAEFADVLNLSDGAPIKIGGLPVGRVHDIRVDGMQAIADLDIEQRFKIPQGSIARLRYDTPLGEMFVDITTTASTKNLNPNAVIPVSETSTAPTVEDTLAQASLLINGGGLSQLQTINHELNNALNGREGTVRHVLDQTSTFLRGANAGAHDITTALQALSSASKALNARRGVFKKAIAEVGPAAQVLSQDTPLLTALLGKTSTLTGRANALLAQTQASLVSVATQLGPILDQVVASTPNYLHGSKSLAAAAAILPAVIPGDFAPLNVTFTVNLAKLLGMSGATGPTSPGSGGGQVLPGNPLLSGLPSLLGGLVPSGSPSSSKGLLGGLLGGL